MTHKLAGLMFFPPCVLLKAPRWRMIYIQNNHMHDRNMSTFLSVLSNNPLLHVSGDKFKHIPLNVEVCLVVQVDWIRGFLGVEGSTLAKAVLWAGIQPVPSRAGPLEAALRSKCVLLLAVTLKRRAVRYTSAQHTPPSPIPSPSPGGPLNLILAPAHALAPSSPLVMCHEQAYDQASVSAIQSCCYCQVYCC